VRSIERDEDILRHVVGFRLGGQNALSDAHDARVFRAEEALESRRERTGGMSRRPGSFSSARGQRHGRRSLHTPIEHRGRAGCDSPPILHPGRAPLERPAGRTAKSGTALAPNDFVPRGSAPLNRVGQAPTRSPSEAKQRLDQKAANKKGRANARRIQSKKAEEA
jgi:hypothetical protein